VVACKALQTLMHSIDVAQIPELERKALTSFNMGASGFILQPEMSSRILSCLVDITDVAGIMANISISGPSIKFMVDDVRIMQAAWACETSCFANNPPAVLTEGLGEVELKPETLRYIVCASRDILEDASVDVESWMLMKVNWAFRNTVSTAILTGDGIGKPLGILNPTAGIPICETGVNTPAGIFTWQDLIMLKWQVPMQFQGAGRFLMNQNSFAQVLTMSDANGRPIMIASPTESGVFLINGSAVQIVTQMPDAVPGAVPVAYGNWPLVYMVVNRKAVTMQQDPYSAGFCVLFKFEARVGGGIICANAARLLRIK
jgi:HK97 family phage major capsid protein